jgi:guanylate kinase
MPDMAKKGKIIVISGPSGVGKSTICREVVRRTGAAVSISMTTRPKSVSEVDGVDYCFVTKDQFAKAVREGGLLEHAEVFGNFYGTPKEPVVKTINEGRNVILTIDVQGGLQVQKQFPDAELVFILPPDTGELVERIGKRGRDTSEDMQRRLSGSAEEMAVAREHYSRMVVNDDLERAINEVIKIVQEVDLEQKI